MVLRMEEMEDSLGWMCKRAGIGVVRSESGEAMWVSSPEPWEDAGYSDPFDEYHGRPGRRDRSRPRSPVSFMSPTAGRPGTMNVLNAATERVCEMEETRHRHASSSSGSLCSPRTRKGMGR